MKTMKISGFLKVFGKENDENLENLWIFKGFGKKMYEHLLKIRDFKVFHSFPYQKLVKNQRRIMAWLLQWINT